MEKSPKKSNISSTTIVMQILKVNSLVIGMVDKIYPNLFLTP